MLFLTLIMFYYCASCIGLLSSFVTLMCATVAGMFSVCYAVYYVRVNYYVILASLIMFSLCIFKCNLVSV